MPRTTKYSFTSLLIAVSLAVSSSVEAMDWEGWEFNCDVAPTSPSKPEKFQLTPNREYFDSEFLDIAEGSRTFTKAGHKYKLLLRMQARTRCDSSKRNCEEQAYSILYLYSDLILKDTAHETEIRVLQGRSSDKTWSQNYINSFALKASYCGTLKCPEGYTASGMHARSRVYEEYDTPSGIELQDERVLNPSNGRYKSIWRDDGLLGPLLSFTPAYRKSCTAQAERKQLLAAQEEAQARETERMCFEDGSREPWGEVLTAVRADPEKLVSPIMVISAAKQIDAIQNISWCELSRGVLRGIHKSGARADFKNFEIVVNILANVAVSEIKGEKRHFLIHTLSKIDKIDDSQMRIKRIANLILMYIDSAGLDPD